MTATMNFDIVSPVVPSSFFICVISWEREIRDHVFIIQIKPIQKKSRSQIKRKSGIIKMILRALFVFFLLFDESVFSFMVFILCNYLAFFNKTQESEMIFYNIVHDNNGGLEKPYLTLPILSFLFLQPLLK